MSSDPKSLGPDDLACPVHERDLPSDRDADVDEQAELSRQRWDNVVRLGERFPELIADPRIARERALTAASQAVLAAGQARRRAEERGVPLEPGVLDVAAQAVPETREAVCRVRDALLWRAEQRSRTPLVLVVLGSVGTGKSCAIGWAVTHHDRSAYHLTAGDVCAQTRNGHSEGAAIWAKRVGYDLLAIDELGREPNPERIVEMVLDRHAAARATLLAGNLSPTEFRERYRDDRLRSRLARQQAQGARVVVMLAGEDMRTGR
jgi:hypothetical protein